MKIKFEYKVNYSETSYCNKNSVIKNNVVLTIEKFKSDKANKGRRPSAITFKIKI